MSDIYENLRKHLDKLPVGYPTTESKIEIKILKQLFEPMEALIATKLSFFPQKLKQIQRKLKKDVISFNNLENILQNMFDKGTIMITEDNGEEAYSNNMFVVGMYEYQLGKLTPDLASNIFQYFKEAFFEKEYNLTGIPQLRTVPVNKAISNDVTIANYDQLSTFIEHSNTIGIMDCICRKAHDLLGDPCKKTNLRETCMTFGSAARYFQEKGLARLITKEEAYQLTAKFEEEGLIPSPSNSQKPFVVCNCCGCCCEVLSNEKRLEYPSRFFASNYHAHIDDDKCTGCNICVDKCQLNAIQGNDHICKIDLGRCIGCGICVINCPNDAIKLIKKKKEKIPPQNTMDTYMQIISKKNQILKG